MKTTVLSLVIGVLISSTASSALADGLADHIAERVETLERASQLIEAQYRSGEATIQQVLDVSTALLDAKLDEATSREQRIEILTQSLERAAEVETTSQKLLQAGAGPLSDHLLAKAARLQVAILLLKQKQRAVKGSG